MSSQKQMSGNYYMFYNYLTNHELQQEYGICIIGII